MTHRIVSTVAVLLLAGCAAGPRPELPNENSPQPQPQARPQPTGSNLLGLTAGDLFQRFGPPALQIREAASLKLQYRSPACVLDAYLYATPPGTPERVTYVDARLPSGIDTDRSRCIATIQRR